MRTLAASASRAGFATFAPSYPSRRLSVSGAVSFLAPEIAAFAAQQDGPLHIITHSLGGLVARALIAAYRPARLGRVVMLGPPNVGSEIADFLYRIRLNGVFLGPVGGQLRTRQVVGDKAVFGPVDYELGIVAGNRPLDPLFPRLMIPRPNDGKVAVAATRLEGMTDHLVLPVSHTLMVYDRRVVTQTISFLTDGRFVRQGAWRGES